MLTFNFHLDYTPGENRDVRRDYNRGDYDSIRNALKLINWSSKQ